MRLRFLVLLISSLWIVGCASPRYSSVIPLGDDLEISFANTATPSGEVPYSIKVSIQRFFHVEPTDVRVFEGVESLWMFTYQKDYQSEVWTKSKGPMEIQLNPKTHLNFNYIVESYDPDLNMVLEYLRLGEAYVTRYFIPIQLSEERSTLVVVGLYSMVAPTSRQYYDFRRMMTSLKITKGGKKYEF